MTDSTTFAIVGGGPAGMVLGLLLARAGIEVTVLEKHADFLRDFRGDTVHPTTLRLLDELGLGARFSALPQSKVDHAEITVDGQSADHGGLPPAAPTASVRRDGAPVGSAEPAGRSGPGRADLHTADVPRGDRAAAQRRADDRSHLHLAGRGRRAARRSDGGLRRPVVDRAAECGPDRARISSSVRRVVVSASPGGAAGNTP